MFSSDYHIELWCYVEGTPPFETFPVRVEEADTVFRLKQVIYDACPEVGFGSSEEIKPWNISKSADDYAVLTAANLEHEFGVPPGHLVIKDLWKDLAVGVHVFIAKPPETRDAIPVKRGAEETEDERYYKRLRLAPNPSTQATNPKQSENDPL
ncbi:hypothetical protein FRB99_007124, partial [Tulasnella sp. 403]